MAVGDGTGLIGREVEEEALATAVESVAAGGARVLIVSGEPGIGKTALLARARDRADRAGLQVFSGRAAEQESDVPFGLVVDALDDHARRVAPDIRERWERELGGVLPALAGRARPDADGGPRRVQVYRGLRGLLDHLAGGRPFAVVLDDVHWADEASSEWVQHLLRRPPESPHLLVVALRPVVPLPALLDALRSSVPGTHLELQPLSNDAALRLIGTDVVDDGRRQRIVAEGGGNPLFLAGLARLPDGETRLPPTVQAAVDLEIAPLAADVRRLLQGAAAAGDPFDAELALAAAGLPPAALGPLEGLVAANLIRPLHGRLFAFRHPLVRRAVHDGTPVGVRLEGHARLARLLRDRGAPPEQVAHHVERSATVGDREAAQVLTTAAAAVLPRAPATAAEWLRTALDLTPAASAEYRVELLRALARAWQAAGRQASAVAALEDALALVDPGALTVRTETLIALADAEHLVGRHDGARDRLRGALDGLPSDAPDGLRARLMFGLAVAASYAQNGQELRRVAGQAASLLDEADLVLAACDEALAMMAAAWTGHADELPRRRAAVRGRFDALSGRPTPNRPYLGYVVGMASLLTEDLDGARVAVTDGLAALEDQADDTALVPLTGLWGLVALVEGNARTARRAATATEEAARLQGAGNGLAQALWLRALVALQDGDLEDASRAEAEWSDVAQGLGDIHMVRTGHCAFALLRAAEDPEGAAATIRRVAGADLDGVESEWSTRRLLPASARMYLATGNRCEAERLIALGERRAERLGLPVAAAAVLRARAELRLEAGDPVGASDLAARAAGIAASHGYVEERLECELLGGRAFARSGRRGEAVAVLRALADRAAEGGAWAYRNTAARELRRLGSRLPAVLRTVGEEGELADRERQIAELAAAGRTNKEVGALLFLSPKTVEHALSRIYAKLGVRGRTELAGVVARVRAGTLSVPDAPSW